jgi:hypothetical protein
LIDNTQAALFFAKGVAFFFAVETIVQSSQQGGKRCQVQEDFRKPLSTLHQCRIIVTAKARRLPKKQSA